MSDHIEIHFTASKTVRDIVIGLADGLTVPFALAAGLSGALDTTTVIVAAGLAEIAAGSIAMGLGGFLAARSDADHYETERQREYHETEHLTEREEEETQMVFQQYGLTDDQIGPIIANFKKSPDQWVDWMMRFELGLEKPEKQRALKSAITIAISYIVGGFFPLVPYIIWPKPQTALVVSSALTLVALAVFGFLKGKFTAIHPWRSAVQTTLIGAAAAIAAYLIARLVS